MDIADEQVIERIIHRQMRRLDLLDRRLQILQVRRNAERVDELDGKSPFPG